MATMYEYRMWHYLDTQNQTPKDNTTSDQLFFINLHFSHVLRLSYPQPTLVPFSSIHNTYLLPRHLLFAVSSHPAVLQGILSTTGVSTDFIHTITPQVSSYFYDLASSTCHPDSQCGVLTVELDVMAVTPFDDREAIHLALRELEAMQEEGFIRFNPATKSCIDGLEKVKADKGISTEDCVICLDEFFMGDEVVRLPCGHVFHGDCGVKWLHTSHLCPLCRFPVR